MPRSFLIKRKNLRTNRLPRFDDTELGPTTVRSSLAELRRIVSRIETSPIVQLPSAGRSSVGEANKREGTTAETEQPSIRPPRSELPLRAGRKTQQRRSAVDTGQKNNNCQKCPKAFSSKTKLAVHDRTHTGEKPYECRICERRFSQTSNLRRHVLVVHTTEKPHGCQYCFKGFSVADDLQKHIRIHTGERPYKCKQCSRAFASSSNLTVHFRTHTGEKPYKCEICNWKFNHSSNRVTHMRYHHPYQLYLNQLETTKAATEKSLTVDREREGFSQ